MPNVLNLNQGEDTLDLSGMDEEPEVPLTRKSSSNKVRKTQSKPSPTSVPRQQQQQQKQQEEPVQEDDAEVSDPIADEVEEHLLQEPVEQLIIPDVEPEVARLRKAVDAMHEYHGIINADPKYINQSRDPDPTQLTPEQIKERYKTISCLDHCRENFAHLLKEFVDIPKDLSKESDQSLKELLEKARIRIFNRVSGTIPQMIPTYVVAAIEGMATNNFGLKAQGLTAVTTGQQEFKDCVNAIILENMDYLPQNPYWKSIAIIGGNILALHQMNSASAAATIDTAAAVPPEVVNRFSSL